MTGTAWLQTSSARLVRVDRIIEVDLWGRPFSGAEAPLAVAGQPARIVARLDTAAEPWREIATVSCPGRGADLIAELLVTCAAAVESRAGSVRYVYGRYEQGELSGWSQGTALPAVSWGRSAVPVPGRWGSQARPGPSGSEHD
ncbi:hypothetical protein ACFYZ8_34080 [Streptomyces sp. NPDC001668]|uniref:hypothetical protein n=1 Tax=Streptomyces sp. NPDC001668 TaxID=3364598 RepID=UPI0036CF4DE0